MNCQQRFAGALAAPGASEEFGISVHKCWMRRAVKCQRGSLSYLIISSRQCDHGQQKLKKQHEDRVKRPIFSSHGLCASPELTHARLDDLF